MAMTPPPDATDTAAPDFPEIFRQYIANSVQATLADIPQDDSLLTADTRDRALHVLSFALKLEVVWPSTRDLLLLLAPKLEQAGYRDDWWPYLEAGVKLSQRCGDRLAEAELRLQVGRLYHLRSQFDAAGQQFAISLTRFCTLGDLQGQARAHNAFAWLGHLQHRYVEATQHVEQSLALLSDVDPERAMSCLIQGMLAIDQRRWQEAEALHRKALTLFERQEEHRRIAWSMQNLAYALRGQKRFEEAISYYEQAVKRLDQLADIHSLGMVQMNLGSTYYYSNKPSEALIHYKQAKLIFNRLHDELNTAKVYTGLGLGYLALQMYIEAEDAFSNSIRLFRALKDNSLRLNSVDGLVMTYLASKQYRQAAEVTEQALGELSTIADAPNYAYLLQSLNQHLAEARQGLNIQ